MRACVVGAGAIGGSIAFGLSEAGCEVSAIARGATLAALRAEGLRFTDGGPVRRARLRACEDPAELGAQDLVVLAVKAPALRDAVSRIAPLLGPDTVVLPAMNGVPWWFFQGGFGGPLAGRTLSSVDPGGAVAAAVPPGSVIGCVVHFGAACPEPGLVSALPERRLIVGECSGAMGARLEGLGALLRAAGFETRLSASIQSEVWYKLWGNMTMNPLSALTGATMDRILDDPLAADFCRSVMAEAKLVGAAIGCPIEQDVEDRIAVTRRLGALKTSMLQDVEAGRAVELDALLAAPVEIAGLVGLAAPSMRALLGLARLQARTLGLYPERRP